jgi:glycerol-3-phosphate dehydrogenase (NAD(P)+)
LALTKSVAVIGTTTWGTTLGIILARNAVSVCLVARTDSEAEELDSKRRNMRFLPDVPFPSGLRISSDLKGSISSAALVILAVPSHQLRQNIRWISSSLTSGTIVVSAAKGLELPGGERMSQVLEQELDSEFHSGICALSGPNLAHEIIQGKISSTVIAGRDPEKTAEAQSILMTSSFRVYTSDDIVGVELAGTLKNIIALGAGIGDGMDAGDNAKSSFITRGLAEITRLGVAAGANPMTFAGLAGLGDVIATCSSKLSRNRYVGEQLALGRTWPDIEKSMDNVAEGVNATKAAVGLAAKLNVEMPIAQTTHRVLFEGLSIQEAVAELMGRPPRSER